MSDLEPNYIGGEDAPPQQFFTEEEAAWNAVQDRHDRENAPTDEYGIPQPHKSYTESWSDAVAPQEVMTSPSTGPFEQAIRGTVGAVAAVAGHFADEVTGVPLGGELAHGEEVNRYNAERAAYEQEVYDRSVAAAQADMAAAQSDGSYGEASYPEDTGEASYDEAPPTSYEWGVDESAVADSYGSTDEYGTTEASEENASY
jgi:hypothetical protein